MRFDIRDMGPRKNIEVLPGRQKVRLTFKDEGEGEEPESVEVPIVFEVCGTCQGRGKVVNPNIDRDGITQEDRERDWDDDEWEGYMTGAYDISCPRCRGEHVEPVINIDMIPEDSELGQKVKLWMRQSREDEWEERNSIHEREMGY